MTLEAPPPAIPLLDLERFVAGATERSQFLEDLRSAARDVGFFYVVGHGIDPVLHRDLLAASHRFFELPQAEKHALDIAASPHFRGYTRVAGERTRGQADWREQLDIANEEPAVRLEPGMPAWLRLKGPNQWPAALPELKPLALRWQACAVQVLIRLMRAFALSLGQDEQAFETLYRDEPHARIKLIRYPGREATSSDQGVGAHKDAGLLSLLLQDGERGLQVQGSQGWIDVPPRGDALVVNVGELLELASNGYLRATVHRVVTPPSGRERLSAAFFLGARLDCKVPLLKLPRELASQAHGPERDPENPLLRDVGWNQLKVRLRSHPDVARRHYADLEDTLPGAAGR
jgi:isopenicillin N synthase-like dioxygenase